MIDFVKITKRKEYIKPKNSTITGFENTLIDVSSFIQPNNSNHYLQL